MPQLRKLIFQLSSLAGSFYLFATRVLADGRLTAYLATSNDIIAVLALVIYFFVESRTRKARRELRKKERTHRTGRRKKKR